jgi:hypothetical protein
MQNSEHANEQLYDKKLYLQHENGALGMAASLKTNRIGFDKVHNENSG